MDDGHGAGQQAQEMAEKTARPLKQIAARALRMLLLTLAANIRYLATHLTGRRTYKRMLSHGSPVKVLERDIKQTDIPIMREVFKEMFGEKAADNLVFAMRKDNADLKAMSGLKVTAGSFLTGRKAWVENFLLAHDGLPNPKMADCQARDDDRIPANVGVLIADADLQKLTKPGQSVADLRKAIADAFEARIEARQCAYYRAKKGENFEEALKDEEMNPHTAKEETKDGYTQPDINDMNFRTAPRSNVGPIHEDTLRETTESGGRASVTVDGETYRKYLRKGFSRRSLGSYAAVTEHGSGRIEIHIKPEEHEKYLQAIRDIGKESGLTGAAFEEKFRIYDDRIFLGKDFPKDESITCFISEEDAGKLAEMAKSRGLPVSMSRINGGYAVTMASEKDMLQELEAYTNEKGGNRKQFQQEKESDSKDFQTPREVADYCRKSHINGIAFIDDDKLAWNMINTFKNDIPGFQNATPESLDRITMSRDDAEKVSDYLMDESKTPALFSPHEIRDKGNKFTMAFVRSAERIKEMVDISHDISPDIESR